MQTIEAFTLLRGKTDSVTLYGTLSQHMRTLRAFNAQGYGVFYTVNQTDGKGRKTAHIIKGRALFADYDNGLPVSFKLTPSLIVESSPGKYQAYWSLHPWTEDLARLEGVQRALVKGTGGDGQALDIARVLRVPGFMNHKYSPPFRVRVLETNANTYTIEQCEEAYGKLETPKHHAAAPPEDSWPPAPQRLARWQKWLAAQEWPGRGERNGTLYRWACAGIKDFAVVADDVEDYLSTLWWQRESDDPRIETIMGNAIRSGGRPIGCAYAAPSFVIDTENK